MTFWKNCCFFVSASVIYLLFGVSITIRKLLTALLNLIIFAKFRHEATNSQLLFPFNPTDICLEKRNLQYGVCVKSILLNPLCPISYKVIALESGITLVIQLCKLENVWFGGNLSALSVAAESIRINYYIIKNGCGLGRLKFLQQQKRKRKSSTDFTIDVTEIEKEVAKERAQQSPIKESTTTSETKKKLQNKLTNILQSLVVTVGKVTFNQIRLENCAADDEKTNTMFNFEIENAQYLYVDNNYLFQLKNFLIRLAADNVHNIVNINLTSPLFCRIDSEVEAAKIGFDDSNGKMLAVFASNSLPEISKWMQNYLTSTKVTKSKKRQSSTKKFRIDLCLSARLSLQTINANELRFCLSNLHCCYDNIIDNNRIFIRLEEGQCKLRNKLKKSPVICCGFGVTECNLYLYEQKSIHLVFCEAIYLKHCSERGNSDDSIVTVAAGMQLNWNANETERLKISFEDESVKHITVKCDGESLSAFVALLDDLSRDMLDTLLPNRLFVPGLAEARHQIHERTDLPLSAAKEKQTLDETDYIQPPTFFIFSFSGEGQCCNVEIKFLESHTGSFCTLALQLASFDCLLFVLPCKLEEFCQYSLASSCAIDFTSIELRDSVVGSHWRSALSINVPTHFRFLQKSRYLPSMQCEKKLRIYTRREKVSLLIHMHEKLLRFFVQFVQNAQRCDVPTTTAPLSKDQILLTSNCSYFLRVSQLDFCVSYKPETAHGSISNSSFLDFKNIPNIALSNAKFSLLAYDDSEPKDRFSACFRNYLAQCLPQIKSLLLSASQALPVVQPLVQTANDLVSDLTNSNRSWKQTASRVTSNVLYGATKMSVATYKIARSTDRWLAKKQAKQRSQNSTASFSFPLQNSPHLTDMEPKRLCDFVMDDYSEQRETDYDATIRKESNSEDDEQNVRVQDIDDEQNVRVQDKDDKDDDQSSDNDDDDQNRDVFGNDLKECLQSKKDSVSIYANQPHSVTNGIREGGSILKENIKIAFEAMIVEPQKAYSEHGGSWRHGTAAALYGLPRVLLRSATGISGAAVKVGHGISNAVDKEKCKERSAKWKTSSYID